MQQTTGNIRRYFYTVERHHLEKRCFRTSCKCQDYPPEGTPPIWAAAVREDWDTFQRCLDEDPLLLFSVTGSVHIYIHDKLDIAPSFYKDLPLIHLVATWSDNERGLRYLVSRAKELQGVVSLKDYINPDYRNGTPLHFAVQWSPNICAIKYLIAEGADIHARNRDGKTPLDYAHTEEAKQFLRERMAM